MSSQPQQPISNRHDDDEIDLFELFQTLWHSKLLIIACSILGLVIAGAYAFTAKEQWTSEAYVSEPQLDSNHDYLSLLRNFGHIKNGAPIDQQKLTEDIFNSFIKEVTSLDNRNKFIVNSKLYKQLAADLTNEQEKRILLNNISTKNLAIDQSGQNEISSYYKISFSADTPTAAQETLTSYLDWVGNLSKKNLIDKFNFEIDSEILLSEKKIKDIEFKLQARKTARIDNLKRALETAKYAGIREYPANQANSIMESSIISKNDGSTVIDLRESGYLFLLGENYLNAELKTEETTAPIYPPEYYNLGHNVNQLKPMHQENIQIAPFSYQLSPSFPISRDKPKRTLIMLIGIILGGMLGVFWALVRDALRKRKAVL